MLYRVCKRMIETGQIDGLAIKIDVFYAAGKLTDDEYASLLALMPQPAEQVEIEEVTETKPKTTKK